MMKKYLINICAIFIAIAITFGLSSFKNRTAEYCVYVIYDGFGDQDDCSNYTVSYTQPFSCPGATRLCWFRVCDENFNGIIDCWDFDVTFSWLDVDWDGSLDDEFEIIGILEKKF